MLTFNIAGKNIVGSVNGEPFSTPYQKETWEKMKSANERFQKAESFDEAEKVFEQFKALLSGETKASSISKITENLVFDEKKNTYHLTKDGKVSPVAIPSIFVEKIKYAHDNDLPAEPIIKFLVRALRSHVVQNLDLADIFLKNLGNYVFKTFVDPILFKQFHEDGGYSEEVARELATVPQTPITMEGLLLTKKVVNPMYDRQRFMFIQDEEGNPKMILRDTVSQTIDEDTGVVTTHDPEYAEDWVFEPAVMRQSGDAFRCGEGKDAPLGHIIRIGQPMWLDSWDQVECSPYRTCSKGLHQGNQDYINHWENDQNVTLNMIVGPEDVGAVVDSEDVLRTKRGFPESIKNRNIPNRNMYHTSTYAAKLDSEWEEEKAAAVERFQEEYEKRVEAAKAEHQRRTDLLI